MGWTPCNVRDESKPIGEQYSCPYSNDPTSSMCESCEWFYNEHEDEEAALRREMEDYE